MEVNIEVSKSAEALIESHLIRNEVFSEEQGIPSDLDKDGLDAQSYHVLAYEGNQVIGVTRLTPIENNVAILSRVAVKKDFRGRGIASQLVKSAIEQAEKLQVASIIMTAHEHLRKFYESFGFYYVHQAKDVNGHRLIKMEMVLS